MGQTGGCFSALKKAIIICHSKYGKKKTGTKSKELDSSMVMAVVVADEEDAKLVEAENEQNRQAYSVAVVTAMAAEAAVAAAHAAAQVVRLRQCKTREEIAATKIQMAFRGFLARRVVRSLKGLARLKSPTVRRQAATTSKCLQTVSHVQYQIRPQRSITMPELGHMHKSEADQKQEALNQGKWNNSTQSKEQIELNLHNRQSAAVRRHRALAYAYTHQKTIRSSSNQTFRDPDNPRWVWNWLDQWMAGRSWESIGSTTVDKESNPGHVSFKSSTTPSRSIHSPTPRKRTRASRRQSPSSTPKSNRATTTMQPMLVRQKVRGASLNADNESRSINSQDGLVPGYMASTESTRAKLRPPSPLRQENSATRTRLRLPFSGSMDSGNKAADVENCIGLK